MGQVGGHREQGWRDRRDRHRIRRASPPDGHTLALVASSHAINPEHVQEASLRHRQELRAGGAHARRAADAGRQSGDSGKEPEGADRVCEGESGQVAFASSGTGGAPHMSGELFAEHGRHRDDPHPVQGQHGRASGPDQRTNVDDVRHASRRSCRTSRAGRVRADRRDHGKTRVDRARRSDHGRGGSSGIRDEYLGRRARTGGNAQGHRRQVERGVQPGSRSFPMSTRSSPIPASNPPAARRNNSPTSSRRKCRSGRRSRRTRTSSPSDRRLPR